MAYHIFDNVCTIDLGSENEILEVGIAACTDPSLGNPDKLRLYGPPIRVVDYEFVTEQEYSGILMDIDVRASASAYWAWKHFAAVSPPVLRDYYTMCAFIAVKTGIATRGDGDTLYVECKEIKDYHLSAEGRDAVQDILKRDSNINKKCIDLMIATKVNWWEMNHHTGQGTLQGYTAEFAANVLKVEYAYAAAYTTMINTCGRWCSTKIVMRLLGKDKVLQVPNFKSPKMDIIVPSDDVKIRIKRAPAGCRRHAIAYAGMNKLINHPVGRFTDIYESAKEICATYNSIAEAPETYHFRSAYLTGVKHMNFEDRTAECILGRLGTFLKCFFENNYLMKSPHLKKGNRDVFKEYDDYDAEFEAVCIAYKRMKKEKLQDKKSTATTATSFILDPNMLVEFRKTFMLDKSKDPKDFAPKLQIPVGKPGKHQLEDSEAEYESEEGLGLSQTAQNKKKKDTK